MIDRNAIAPVQAGLGDARDLDGALRAGDGAAPIRTLLIDDLARLFWRRRRLFLLVFLAVVIPATAVILAWPPKYTAHALVVIDPRPPRTIDIPSVVGPMPDDRTMVLSEIEIIRSSDILLRAMEILDIFRLPEFNPDGQEAAAVPAASGEPVGWGARSWAVIEGLAASITSLLPSPATTTPTLSPEQQRTRILERFQKRVEVVSLGGSRVIEIGFTSRDPALAAAGADAIARVYVERQQQLAGEANRAATQWLTTQANKLEDEVRDAEQEVERFREEAILATGYDVELLNGQINELGLRLIVARSEVQSDRAEYQETLARSDSSVAANTLQAHPVLDQLRAELATLHQREAELAGTYGARHPRVAELREAITRAEQQIDAEVRDVLDGLAKRVTVSEQIVEGLETQLAGLQQQRVEANRADIQLRALERAASADREVLNAFLRRARETAQIDSNQPQTRIVSTASVPAQKSRPKTNLLLVGALALGGLAGIGSVITAENANRSGFLSLDQIEDELGLPIHAVLPQMSRRWGRRGGNVFTSRGPSYGAAWPSQVTAAVAVSLTIAVRRKGFSKTVLFTSAMPGEGKSSIVAATAAVLAGSGCRVLVVEGDPHRPRVGRLLGVEGGLGLAEACTRPTLPASALVRSAAGANLDVVTVGSARGEAERILQTGVVSDTVDALQANYDIVLIDAPPILPVPDTRLLLEASRHGVLVVRWRSTSKKAVRHAVRLMVDAGAEFSGVILNGVDLRQIAAFDYTEAHYLGDASYREYFTAGRLD